MSPHSIGVLQIIMSGTLFVSIGLVGKLALERGVGPLEMVGGRFLVSSGFLIDHLLVFLSHLLHVPRREALIFAGLGVWDYSVLTWSFFMALETILATSKRPRRYCF